MSLSALESSFFRIGAPQADTARAGTPDDAGARSRSAMPEAPDRGPARDHAESPNLPSEMPASPAEAYRERSSHLPSGAFAGLVADLGARPLQPVAVGSGPSLAAAPNAHERVASAMRNGTAGSPGLAIATEQLADIPPGHAGGGTLPKPVPAGHGGLDRATPDHSTAFGSGKAQDTASPSDRRQPQMTASSAITPTASNGENRAALPLRPADRPPGGLVTRPDGVRSSPAMTGDVTMPAATARPAETASAAPPLPPARMPGWASVRTPSAAPGTTSADRPPGWTAAGAATEGDSELVHRDAPRIEAAPHARAVDPQQTPRMPQPPSVGPALPAPLTEALAVSEPRPIAGSTEAGPFGGLTQSTAVTADEPLITTTRPGSGADRAGLPAAEAAIRQITAAMSGATESERIEVRLDPPELGRVEIRFDIQDDGLRASIAAERSVTLDALRRHVELLQDALRNAGFSNIDLSFSDRGGERRGSADEHAPPWLTTDTPPPGHATHADPSVNDRPPGSRSARPLAENATIDLTL